MAFEIFGLTISANQLALAKRADGVQGDPITGFGAYCLLKGFPRLQIDENAFINAS